MRIKITETALGIFKRVKKSKTGESIKERKMAKKNGKRTGLASHKTTPPIKTTTIMRQAVITLFPFIELS